LFLESLTGSKKVVEMLNRYGYCASYTSSEELETELTYSVTSDTRMSPKGMRLDPSYCSGLAFDNFDHYVETLGGKNTLHDTVGISYQRVPTAEELQEHNGIQESSSTNNKGTTRKKRRRTFEPSGLTIEPYYKNQE
jgi:hypothetical protein